jgi:hypothetical protein
MWDEALILKVNKVVERRLHSSPFLCWRSMNKASSICPFSQSISGSPSRWTSLLLLSALRGGPCYQVFIHISKTILSQNSSSRLSTLKAPHFHIMKVCVNTVLFSKNDRIHFGFTILYWYSSPQQWNSIFQFPQSQLSIWWVSSLSFKLTFSLYRSS